MEKVTEEYIKEAIKSLFKFNGQQWSDLEMKHLEWEENGQKFSCWKMGNFILGDGAKREFDRILNEEINNT